jgi:hypothetical protein
MLNPGVPDDAVLDDTGLDDTGLAVTAGGTRARTGREASCDQ